MRNREIGVANAFNFTLGRNHVSKVANKKFKALVSGNTNATASKRVMRELIEGIQNLKI